MSETTALQHKPFKGPRSGFIGETVMAEKWAEWMRLDSPHFRRDWDWDCDVEERWPLEIVLRELRYPVDQAAASMAASLVTWLGTNVGRSVLSEGERIRKTGAVLHPYLVAWTLENQRHNGINGGIQIIEFLLSSTWQWKTLPEPTARDIEVCDHVMRWIAEERGQAFLRSCRAEIEKRDREDRDRRLAKHEKFLQDFGLRPIRGAAA